MIKMVVFLGNKGRQYEKTRHNVAWRLGELITDRDSLNSKFSALYCNNSSGTIFIYPQKMMNLSGESVVKAMQFFKIKIEEVLVVHDDLETSFGSIKIKDGGGLGGHNGLKSIKKLSGSNSFKRVAIGVSRPKRGDVSSHVLGRFSVQEEAELTYLLNETRNYVEEFLNGNSKNLGKKIKILEQVED